MADVLVVDDSTTIRKVVVKALGGAGLSCDEASNGAEGLHLALLNAYRLLIIDVQMPVMGGLNLIAALRSRDRTRAVPVLVLTSDNDMDTVEHARGLGIGGYLLKPVSRTSLLERVLPLLNKG